MRIAILQDDFPPHHDGGAGLIAYRIARGLVQRGHSVLVITTVRARADAGEFEEEGLRIVCIFSAYPERFRAYIGLWNPFIARAIARHLSVFAPDIVHAHSVSRYLSYYALIIARRFSARVYTTEHDAMSIFSGKLPSETDPSAHGDSAPIRGPRSFTLQAKTFRLRFNPLRAFIVRHIFKIAVARSVVVSHALERALNANGIQNTLVIQNGIDTHEWGRSPSTDEFIARHHIGARALLFGGRFSEPKGGLAVIAVFARIRGKIPDAQLLLIGRRNAFAERMHEYAKKLGVADGLVWIGWATGEELRSAYHAAAAVAVPSLYLDPFPTVNLEAYACHKPVIATCFGGSHEIVEDGVTGYLVNPLNTEQFADKAADLLLNTRVQHAFGEAGYARVTKEFSLEQQVAQYEALYGAPQDR
ncbi:MAG: glycosyltransferase family 4 protein [Patescibacteria group bacterium]|nr:glycosyltransferase family 4 protein [Patescibacteria group bacterium]